MFITSYKSILTKKGLMVLEPVRDYMYTKDDVLSTSDAANVFTQAIKLQDEADEVVVGLCLNAAGRITGMFEMTTGGINSCMFDVGGIIRKALFLNAVSLIIAHNHPGGTLAPSAEDLDATERIKKACELVGIRFLDHFIIAGITGDYKSLRSEGYMN